MKASANEVMTLAAKAARGAGAAPEQAAEFGRAALCHLIAGRGDVALRAATEALPEGPIVALPVAFAQMHEAAEDGIVSGVLPLDPLTQSYIEAQPFAPMVREDAGMLLLQFDLTRPNAIPPVARVDLPDDLAAYFKRLAAKTFVPESAASRLSGAGAGLTDND